MPLNEENGRRTSERRASHQTSSGRKEHDTLPSSIPSSPHTPLDGPLSLPPPPRTPEMNGAVRALDGRVSERGRHDAMDQMNRATSVSPERDSHDLTYSQRGDPNDALVDNMLLSLDQFAVQQPVQSALPLAMMEDERPYYTTLRDEPTSPPPTSLRFSLFKGGRRRHTQSSSQSSEFVGEQASSYSGNPSHGRNNDSTSTHQSSLKNIERINGRGRIESQRAAPPVEHRRAHSRGRGSLGSKGSGYSSVDLGSTQRAGMKAWATMMEQRPMSFDQDYGDRVIHSSPAYSNPLAVQIPTQTLEYSYDDAAPTPTVRGGPSRRPSPPPPSAYPPPPSHPPPEAPALERKRSTRSSKSHHNKKGRFMGLGGNKSRPDDIAYFGDPREIPPVPLFDNPSAPSPTVPYGKPLPVATPEFVPPSKERPGFFRRMFSSSKQPANQDFGRDPLAPGEPESWLREARQRQASGQSTPQRIGSGPSLTLREPPEPQPIPAPLNKKPSGFFRRRKKSVSEAMPPPALPPQLRLERGPDTSLPQTSPVSSLRKVMNPFLEQQAGSPETYFDTNEHFYTPDEIDSPKASPHARGYFPESASTARTVRRFSSLDSADVEPKTIGNLAQAAGINAASPSARANWSKQIREGTTIQERGNDRIDPRRDDAGHAPHKDGPERSVTYPTVTSSSASRKMAVGLMKQEMPTRPPPEPKTLASSNLASPVLASPAPEESAGSKKARNHKAVLSISTDKDAMIKEGERAREQPFNTADDQVDSPDSPAGSPSLSLKKRPSSPIERNQAAQDSSLSLPVSTAQDSVRESDASDYKSATSLPIVQVDDGEVTTPNDVFVEAQTEIPIVEEPAELDEQSPTAEEREQAQGIFDGEEHFIVKGKAAAWLGESSPASERTRRAYMELFDWSNLSILAGLRSLCGQLILKGETQQVDRILDSFASRWCQCNPNHGFKALDVVHTICYSLLLLNTDLHLADIDQKMTRSQFVKNTMPTIRRVAMDAAPESVENPRASILANRSSTLGPEPLSPLIKSPLGPAREGRSSLDLDRPSRMSARPSILFGFDDSPLASPAPIDFDTNTENCGPLVRAPFNGSWKSWEVQLETVLKSFFTSIKNQRLPLHGAPIEDFSDQKSSNSLAVSSGAVGRTPSVLSKSPSETMSFRGRPEAARLGTGRWSSKTRSRPRVYPNSAVASSRTSFDDQSSVWSPSASSTWSKHSLGKTQTSMSVESFGSSYHQSDYQQSIGFANALSQAIIREEASNSADPPERIAALLEDETLELAGAPWAKEGILKHKHHLEAVDKKSKDRTWNECFAVIEKGWMRLFSFSSKSSSMRSRNKSRNVSGGIVGGGNWMESAETLGSFLLRQTIASVLPPPGYSKSRPHVWALSLPTGAVHLFQVGTPDIVKEFVSTANYWSARLSKEPLVGGISNIEYGWSNDIINSALLGVDSMPSRTGSARPSIQSSIRSAGSFDQGGSLRAKLPGDRVMISDWHPPGQSMMASQLMEVDQLKALQSYVSSIERELSTHNELRAPMLLAFSPRHHNAAKAMANWERKSSYLLREIVKFGKYIDSLSQAQTAREELYAERQGKEESATNASKAKTAAAAAVEKTGESEKELEDGDGVERLERGQEAVQAAA